ncbi:uncharacterized protein LOC127833254 [Dreissena polymorpha]|nr:uncharacterized protein LOC127833254 [Dreissena polymorpha]
MMKGMDKCRDHDKKVKFFCEDYSKLCCNTCAFIHRKCENVNELASLSSQEGLELEDLNHMLLKLETETCSIISDCNLSEVALSETNANIPKQVDEMKDRIIEIFDKAKSRMIEEAENFKDEEMKRLGERRKATSNVNEDIHELLPVSSALIKHGKPQQKYIISHILKEKIKYIETHIIEQRNKHITSNVALNFSKQLSSLLKEEEGIVKLNAERHLTYKDAVQTGPTKLQESSEVKKETTVLNKDVSPTARAARTSSTLQKSPSKSYLSHQVTAESAWKAQPFCPVTSFQYVVNISQPIVQVSSDINMGTTDSNKGSSSDIALSAPIKPLTLELIVSMDLQHAGYGIKEPFFTGLDFFPDGRLVAVDNINRKCIILDDHLQSQGTSYTFNKNPFEVVCLSDSDLAVTMCEKSVFLLTVSSSNDIYLIIEIKISSNVFSACCMTPETMIVSTYDDSRPVRMLSLGGVETDFDHAVVPKKFKLWGSKITYVKSNNMLVLTDRFANKVHMYNTMTRMCREVTDENLKEPRGVCVHGNTVLVCSRLNNCIVHLTVDGNILGTYSVDLNGPYSICINSDETRLAVSGGETGNTKLLLYKMHKAYKIPYHR